MREGDKQKLKDIPAQTVMKGRNLAEMFSKYLIVICILWLFVCLCKSQGTNECHISNYFPFIFLASAFVATVLFSKHLFPF